MEKQIPELLAPAGSMDALNAAINAGADAVYLAGKQFGARHYAANFDNEQLKKAVNYAHFRGVKVYVTVNTLIKDQELQKMGKYLLFLYEIGVDAILVQDTGVAKLSKKIVPDLNLHASTQMTIHNLEGVKWASEFGFKRVVLAREVQLSQIQEIGRKIKSEEIELEIFTHGALCYSYSGQCLLSSFIGGRSGNRGMCAQPCRRKYRVVSGKKDAYGRPAKLSAIPAKGEYMLSTRDLSLYKHLPRIVNSNVRSLKIEGRMRSPEYVAIVVSIYRNALDSIAKGKWKAYKKDINNLKLAFNRDFTGGYILESNYSNVMGRNLPGNRGIYAGSLIEYNNKTKEALIEIKEDIIPQKGDGIVFMPSNPKEREYGMVVNESPEIYKKKLKLKVNAPLKKGTSIYITRRKKLVDKAQKIINGTHDDLKNKIMVDLKILVQKNGNIMLKSKFNGNMPLKLETVADFKMEKAIKKPLDKKTIETQLTKTGGTPFKIQNIQINYPGNLFAPLSELNKLRRDLFKEIEDIIISSYLPSEEELKNSKKRLHDSLSEFSGSNKPSKEIPELGIYVNDLKSLNGAINGGCMRIYFDPFVQNSLKCQKKYFNIDKLKERILKANAICKSSNTTFILKLPKITSNSDLKKIIELIKRSNKSGINEFLVDGIGAANAMMNLNSPIIVHGSAGLNVWNHLSVEELSKLFNGLTISPELSKSEIKKLTNSSHNVSLEMLVQGNIESIVSKDCIPCIDNVLIEDNTFLGLQDIKNQVFPVLLDNKCHTYILNSVELSLIDHLPFILKTGIDTVIIDARGRGEKYTFEICSIYNDALQINARRDPDLKNRLNSLKNKIKKISLGGITTGNFIRGITEK